MRLALVLLAFTLSLLDADAARADTSRTCTLVETLAGLPDNLRQVRRGKGDADKFQRQLAATRFRLNDNRSAALFSAADLFAMRSFLAEVSRNWNTHGARRTNGQATDRAIVSLQNRGKIAEIVKRFGCNYPKTREAAPLRGFDAGTIGVLTVLGIVAGLLAIVFIIVKVLRYGHRDERLICRVPAKLEFGGQTYQTQIMNISCGGVMVQTPEKEMGDAPVTLGLPTVQISSRVVWTNSNFAGLVFDKKISHQMVEDIAKIKPIPLFPASDDPSSARKSGVPSG